MEFKLGNCQKAGIGAQVLSCTAFWNFKTIAKVIGHLAVVQTNFKIKTPDVKLHVG